MLHYIQNKSIIIIVIIPFTLLFGAIGYLYYKSKDEVSLIEVEKLDSPSNQLDQDDLYKDLEDLFIWLNLFFKISLLLFSKAHIIRMQA